MPNWTTADIPPQAGRTAIVTGTGGLGLEVALALARAGAGVILAGRNEAKGTVSVAQIVSRVPAARIRFELLDLADLRSVAAFGARTLATGDAIDLLINNAGVASPPIRRTTADGFELQFGTNHLGHVALTAQLLPALRRAAAARVVSVSSLVHRTGKIQFDDLQGERVYKPFPAYAQSKLAVLMFALELHRRSEAAGWGVLSNAAHPGYARTDLMANGPGTDGIAMRLTKLIEPVVSQDAATGALPILFAATSADAAGGGYYGPDGFYELKGFPRPAKIMPRALDAESSARLWQVSLQLTGAAF